MRRIGLLGVLALAVMSFNSAQAQNLPGFTTVVTNPYDVKDVTAEATAENAVVAREKAFGVAMNLAFTKMLAQIEPDEAKRAGYKVPDTAVLGQMLQDFTTSNEKLSTTQYSATFDMRFKPGRVQRYLQSAGIPAAVTPTVSAATPSATPVTATSTATTQAASRTVQLQPVLMLPFYQTANGIVLWSGDNPVRDALAASGDQSALMKMTVGDLGDIQMFQEQRGLQYNPAQFATLLHKYGTEQAIITVAVPDALSAPRGVAVPAASKLTLMYYYASLRNPTAQYLDSAVVSLDAGQAPADLFAKAAAHMRNQVPVLLTRLPREQTPETDVAVNAVIVNNPGAELPAGNVMPYQSTQYVPMRVAFQTLTEWQNIRARLSGVPAIKSVRVTRLKSQEAQIELVYQTSLEQVLAGIEGQGLRALRVDPSMAAVPVNATANVAATEPAAGGSALYTLSLKPVMPNAAADLTPIPAVPHGSM